MNRTKVLITGATGFIGRNFTERLGQRPEFDVHAVRFTRSEFACPGVTWHQVDLTDPVAVDQIVAGMDVLIQAAATTSGAKDIVNTPDIHVTDNAVMNSYLLRSAYRHKLKHVVFFSCTVMYHTSATPLKESDFDPARPLHPKYFGVGQTKLYVEKLCEFYSNLGETRFTVIRHSNIYGPHDKFDLERSHVFGATVTKVMTASEKLTVWGSGQEARDFLHVDDLIEFVEAALSKQTANFRIYNCGSGVAVTINDLVAKIVSASGKDLKIEHDPSKPTIATSLCVDCTLANDELSWHPRMTLENGIANTIAWWKENVVPEK